MKIAGIVAEYNPFHNGHAFLIEKAREAGAEYVAAVMSGNFVQRGEAAIFRDDVRAKAALACGADIVIQLPVTYAVSGAKNFASGAVKTLDSLGCVDTIFFGSESGNTKDICRCAELLEKNEVQSAINSGMKKGLSYASVRENAVAEYSPECAEILKNPNDILGVEYASALRETGSRIKPFAVGRTGAEHNSDIIYNNIASASLIRKIISGCGDYKNLVPENAYEIFSAASGEQKLTDTRKLETAILYKMRTCTARELAACPDVSEGLENRIIAAAKQAASLEELYSTVKTKRYSHARIRRIVMNCFLGITAEDARIPVSYIRVLGFGKKGAELLGKAYETASLPIITKASELKNADENAQKLFEIENRAGDIYALCADKTGACSDQINRRIIML